MQEVIEAITTSPFLIVVLLAFTLISIDFCAVFSPKYVGRIFSNAAFESDSEMRSCGRFGPAMEGTTVDKSSSMFSEKRGDTSGLCQRPCSFAYWRTNSTCSVLRPVRVKYRNVSSSIGKIAQVEPYSGLMFPIVVRLAIGTETTPGP